MLPVLNPKSYDGARVLEASGRPMLVIGRSYVLVSIQEGTMTDPRKSRFADLDIMYLEAYRWSKREGAHVFSVFCFLFRPLLEDGAIVVATLSLTSIV